MPRKLDYFHRQYFEIVAPNLPMTTTLVPANLQ